MPKTAGFEVLSKVANKKTVKLPSQKGKEKLSKQNNGNPNCNFGIQSVDPASIGIT